MVSLLNPSKKGSDAYVGESPSWLICVMEVFIAQEEEMREDWVKAVQGTGRKGWTVLVFFSLLKCTCTRSPSSAPLPFFWGRVPLLKLATEKRVPVF